MFRHAIVRTPGANFADGLTRVDLGVPAMKRVFAQHTRYCQALQACGLLVTALPADGRFPDGTFVEDTAIVLPEGVMLTRPGAGSRRGEVAAIGGALAAAFPAPAQITTPGTLDGGDVCVAGRQVLIGLSARSNAEGVAQLADWLAGLGYAAATIDIRGIATVLHLKSGLSWLGDGRMLVIEELAGHPALAGFEPVRVDPVEAYAANAVRVNDHLLVAEGYPRLQSRLQDLGYACLALPMSEFERMDGGLSCLSLRY